MHLIFHSCYKSSNKKTRLYNTVGLRVYFMIHEVYFEQHFLLIKIKLYICVSQASLVT
jgi:hypothetical protein